jgi:polyadenylate-binding protein
LPLPKADPLVVQATDEFIDGLLDKPPQVQKQQLGDKLFKTVKSFGIKAAVRLFFIPFSSVDAHAFNSRKSRSPSSIRRICAHSRI